jgi:hypothetical protein
MKKFGVASSRCGICVCRGKADEERAVKREEERRETCPPHTSLWAKGGVRRREANRYIASLGVVPYLIREERTNEPAG